MNTDYYFIAVTILMIFAVLDLIVGVTNDAVNFLNSAIGSKVAPRHVIMIIASLGILAGVTFSSGMMEVARKGIFHPQFFTMPELLTIFLAVMLTDIILLDLFNTFGLPTSTTVSIVFELLGAAVAVSIIKVVNANGALGDIGDYINSSKAIMIIGGILLSVVVAFAFGALAQFLSRLLFTFDYMKRMKRYGAIWGGIALASITFFILIKGSKGASFMSKETISWIKTNAWMILLSIFVVSTIILQLIMTFSKTNILKIIILIGTFALAMAFAANDLVNFIGVPLAGLHAYKSALLSSDPLGITMGALSKKVSSETFLLLIAGAVMVITLWVSKKAKTVSETELSLGQQEEGTEKFESTKLSRGVVSMVSTFFNIGKVIIPKPVRVAVDNRINPEYFQEPVTKEDTASFDLIRASVNLMVASAVVSFATSLKLPLSTTYVTFMVSMGTSFSDRAWGRDSAVYRITGVLTVIGGWFMTALMAFTISFVFANIIHYFGAYGVVALLALVVFSIWRSHFAHKNKAEDKAAEDVFNLSKENDPSVIISASFEHFSLLLKEMRKSLEITFSALFCENRYVLKKERKRIKRIQKWSNIITANTFKALRLLQKEDVAISYKYSQTIRRLQKLADAHRDIVTRSYRHVGNHHKGLLPVQIDELKEFIRKLVIILQEVELAFSNRCSDEYGEILALDNTLRKMAELNNSKQIERIKDSSSKTRLSMLYYSITGDSLILSKQTIKLMEIFQQSFCGKQLQNTLDDLE